MWENMLCSEGAVDDSKSWADLDFIIYRYYVPIHPNKRFIKYSPTNQKNQTAFEEVLEAAVQVQAYQDQVEQV